MTTLLFLLNEQSSINSVDGLGTASLSTVYAAIVVSCMFVPTWLIKTIKCKWTVASCQLCYCAYIAAQFYPKFYTLVPTAIILGFGAAPMWSAKCTYLTQVVSHTFQFRFYSYSLVGRIFSLIFLFVSGRQRSIHLFLKN